MKDSIIEIENTLFSRIHPLPSYQTELAKVWVKREDELGFGVSGCKKRKYLSLLPFVLAHKWEYVVLIGGENSNHLQAFLQLLNEHKIPVKLYVKQQKNTSPKGNSFLLHLLAQAEDIRYVDAQDWSDVNQLAEKELQAMKPDSFFLIPEGGSCKESIAGLATLLSDLERNEAEEGIDFDHIFIDAGTCLTAAVLAFQLAIRKRNTQLHIVYVAGNEDLFLEQWAKCKEYYQMDIEPHGIHHHKPASARSFGSTNATIWSEIRFLARQEGLLTDPVYTAKLFYTARQLLHSQLLTGNVLIIHSGGGTGLMGFV